MRRAEELPGIDRDFLALVFEASRDCLKMLAADGTILAINSNGARALGFESSAESVGRNWLSLLSDDGQTAAETAIAAARGGVRSAFRAMQVRPDGEARWWDSTVIPVPAVSGLSARLLVISHDITEQHKAQHALNRSTRLQEALIEATSDMVWHVNVATGITTRSGYAEFTGLPDDPRDMDGWLNAVHPDDRDRAKVAADAAGAAGRSVIIEYRLLHRAGEWRWVEHHAAPVRDDDGAVTDWVGIIADIHARKVAEQALRKNVEYLRLAVEATGLGTWDVDVRSGERDWSPEMFDLLRIPRDTVADRALFLSVVYPEDRARVAVELQGRGGRGGRPDLSVFRLAFADGSERWVEAHERTFYDGDGLPVRRVGTLQDITERKQAEIKAWLAAHTDPLTGVANRALFHNRLEDAVATARGDFSRLALVLIDLDRFKEVNDSLGHDAGDTLLQTMAERILHLLPAAATVARLGGDEFGVLIPVLDSVPDVERLCTDLLVVLNTPFVYEQREVECSASLGWASFPDQADEPSALLKNADVALYAAKSAGRSRVARFTPAMKQKLERRLTVLRNAREALANDGIVPFYQPKIELATGCVLGFEALLRWTDRGRLHAPGLIQEALDDPEWSCRLGARMLERSVADAAAWAAADVPFGHVGLNVATAEFQGGLVDRVLETLGAAELRPDQLEIEVTERLLLDDDGTIGATLRKLHESGVRIALDDFGTGFASLTHLTRFPVSWVKIDRSFTSRLAEDAGARAIVRAVVDLAHNLKIRVAAEGVEAQLQLDFLQSAGCDLGQGYFFAKPMAASRVAHFLRRWREREAGSPTMPARVAGLGAR